MQDLNLRIPSGQDGLQEVRGKTEKDVEYGADEGSSLEDVIVPPVGKALVSAIMVVVHCIRMSHLLGHHGLPLLLKHEIIALEKKRHDLTPLAHAHPLEAPSVPEQPRKDEG